MAIGDGSGLFVGRGGEVGVLRGLVAGVAAGGGGVAWVEGEPGIGKSALVREGLAEAAGLGCAVFWGSADRLRQGFPLGVMLDCLGVDGRSADPVRAQIVGVPRGEGAGGVVPAGDAVVAAAERCCELVDRLCAVSPVVLVIDDLQWADEVSVSVWHRLAGSTGSGPLLVVGVARPVPRPAAVADVRRAARDRGEVVMELGPLAAGEVAAMVGGLAGGVPGPGLLGLAGRAAGNPLYVRELVDALVREDRVRVKDGVAEAAGAGQGGLVSLAAAIEDRLAFLSERALESLRVAAMLGARFSAADLAVVQGCTVRDVVEVVREAVRAGVLTSSGTDLVFRHGLIQQALVDGVPAALRVELHREAARALAAAGAPVENVAAQLLAVASAGAAGVTDGWMVDWLAANAPAIVHRAPKIAAGLLEQAAAATPAGDARREVLEEALAGVLLLLGRHQQAEAVARRLLEITGDADRRARVTWTLAYTLARIARFSPALAVVDQALSDPAISPVWTARLLSMRAQLITTGDVASEVATTESATAADVLMRDGAEAIAQAALAGAERAGDRLAAGYALHTLSAIRQQAGDEAGVVDVIERALAVIGDDPETTDLRLLLMSNRLGALFSLGRRADDEARQLLALARQVGTARLGEVHWMVSEYLFAQGRWDDALAELAPLFEPAAEFFDLDRLAGHGVAALIALHRDDRAALERHLTEGDHLPDPGGLQRVYAVDLTLARALAAERAGQPADAMATLAEAAHLDRLMHLDERVNWLPDLVRCALAAGDPAIAATAVSQCERQASADNVMLRAAAAARRCRGLADGSPEPLAEAVSYLRTVAWPLELAQTLEDLAVVHGTRGDVAQSGAALREAVAIYTELGAEWDIVRADARVRPYGVRRRRAGTRRPATGWDALTPTETKIAYLVAEGLSNPDIGARLFLSWRTVRFHVSAIMAKLGVHSRNEIKPPLSHDQAAHG